MGCGASSEGVTEADFNDPTGQEFLDDCTRFKTDKKTGDDVKTRRGDIEAPEDDAFEFDVEEVVEGEQFGAVKPWIGQIKEPTNHPPVNKAKPD